MTAGMPFYVSPEQLMKDRADFARKGIARGRSVIVLAYDNGIAFVADARRSEVRTNNEAFQNMKANLERLGLDAHGIPVVIQYIDDKSHVVGPKSQAQREAVLPLPAGSTYSYK